MMVVLVLNLVKVVRFNKNHGVKTVRGWGWVRCYLDERKVIPNSKGKDHIVFILVFSHQENSPWRKQITTTKTLSSTKQHIVIKREKITTHYKTCHLIVYDVIHIHKCNNICKFIKDQKMVMFISTLLVYTCLDTPRIKSK